jgi:hypothetical protein
LVPFFLYLQLITEKERASVAEWGVEHTKTALSHSEKGEGKTKRKLVTTLRDDEMATCYK